MTGGLYDQYPSGMLIDMQTLVATGELEKLFRLTRKRVQELTRKPDFPAPVAELGAGRIWRTDEVLAFAERTGRKAWDPDFEDEVLYDPSNK